MSRMIILDDIASQTEIRFEQFCAMLSTVEHCLTKPKSEAEERYKKKIKFISLASNEMMLSVSPLQYMEKKPVSEDSIKDMLENFDTIAKLMEPALDFPCSRYPDLKRLGDVLQGAFLFLKDTMNMFESCLNNRLAEVA